MALEIYEQKKDEKYLKSAFKGVNRGIDLIRQMKELESLIETTHELNSINVREIIGKVAPIYQIDYSVDGNCQIIADQAIKLVIGNIIDNAIKHGKADKINFKLLTKEKTCEIIIQDNGISVSPEVREKIFEAGFGYGENRGTGLGLYIVKKTLERYGGYIKVQDSNIGTTFIITLNRSL